MENSNNNVKKVNLIWLSDPKDLQSWKLGNIYTVSAEPTTVFDFLNTNIALNDVEAWLLWDGKFGFPDAEFIERLLSHPYDIYHQGLTTGMAGQPDVIKFVAPGWMYSVDADPEISPVSWRLNLRCCLIRSSALKELGLPSVKYDSIEASGLELGFRYIKSGGLLKHIPNLSSTKPITKLRLSFRDQIRFVFDCFGKNWATLVLLQKFWLRPLQSISSYREMITWKRENHPQITSVEIPPSRRSVNISVVLPTLKRYDYLPTCLESLRKQSLLATEIICVDQNPESDRRPDIYENFRDLPIKVIWQDVKGQSIARNQALLEAKGEWLFFSDDDSVYPPDALQKHWDLVNCYCADVSTGVSVPPREYQMPKDYLHVRIAHNLETGNSLIRKTTVLEAGGFDQNFDFGKGADLDLGMRIYKSGGINFHNPLVHPIHYKAQGGLREFGVLWDNRSVDRKSPKPPATISYYYLRHFPKTLAYRAIIQMVLLSSLPSSQVVDGRESQVRKSLVVEILKFPLTLPRVIKSIKAAQKMLKQGPKLLKV